MSRLGRRVLSGVSRSTGALLLLVLALASFGCAKESAKEEAPLVAPMPSEEVTRGRQACDAYVERVCACANSHADLADECALSKARPEAFELNLKVMASTGLDKIELQAAKVEARKIAAACFEADGRLDQTKCPRPSK